MALVKMADIGDVTPGTGKVLQVGERTLALFNVEGTFHAIDNACPHAGGPLGEGKVEGHVVTCPWHGSRFDITNGQVLGPPARRPVTSYAVRVQGSEVVVELP
jgi:nitrite reductase (NADH) small subunit/3-phenylpropionate/trans-cinnamate dioxygenase ferredoxin subunit